MLKYLFPNKTKTARQPARQSARQQPEKMTSIKKSILGVGSPLAQHDDGGLTVPTGGRRHVKSQSAFVSFGHFTLDIAFLQ